jgi:hypothetical protein
MITAIPGLVCDYGKHGKSSALLSKLRLFYQSSSAKPRVVLLFKFKEKKEERAVFRNSTGKKISLTFYNEL